MFGFIKNRGTVGLEEPLGAFDEYAWIMVIVGGIGFIAVVHVWRVVTAVYSDVTRGYSLRFRKWQVANAIETSGMQQSTGASTRLEDVGTRQEATQGDIKKMTALVNSVADTCTFVSGNVFYQILFSQMSRTADNTERGNFNWLYFGTATLALVFGMVSVVLGSFMAVWGNDFATEELQNEFDLHTRTLQAVLMQFYDVALILWVFSFVFLAPTNFTHTGGDWSWVTYVFGGLCLVVSVVALLKTKGVAHKYKSRRLYRKAHEGCLPFCQFVFGPITTMPFWCFAQVQVFSWLDLFYVLLVRTLLTAPVIFLVGGTTATRWSEFIPVHLFSPYWKSAFAKAGKQRAVYVDKFLGCEEQELERQMPYDPPTHRDSK
jgi:hypothetical protein